MADSDAGAAAGAEPVAQAQADQQQAAPAPPQEAVSQQPPAGFPIEGASNDQLLSLAQQYRAEFESTFDGLRRRGQAIQETVQQQIGSGAADIAPQKELALAIVQDISDVASPPQLVLQSYLWSSVLVAAFGFASLLGTYLFAPIVNLLLGTFGLVAVSLIGLPALALFHLKQLHAGGASDPEVRMRLFSFALANGVVFGSLISHHFLFAEPVAFVFPLVIALSYLPAQKSLGGSRINLLGATVGGALFASLVLGLLTSTVSGSYLFEAFLLSGVSVLSLQFFFKTVQSEADVAVSHVHQLAYLSGVVLAKALSFGLLAVEYQ